MNVLISGGIKSQNIVDALKKKFSSGIEFTVEQNISNIKNYFARGNYFDRAIIVEQAWTNDWTIQDEAKIRENISQFISTVKDRLRNFEIIFLVMSNYNMVKIVLEETFNITAYSTVLFKEPPYDVQFFTTLVIEDLNKMPEKYVMTMKKVMDNLPKRDEGADIEWSKPDSENEEIDNLQGPLLDSAKEAVLNEGIKELDDSNDEDSIENAEINEELFGNSKGDLYNSEDFTDEYADLYDANDEIDDDSSDVTEELNELYNYDEDNQGGYDFSTFDDFDGEDSNFDNISDESFNTYEFDSEERSGFNRNGLDTFENSEDNLNEILEDAVDIEDSMDLSGDEFDFDNIEGFDFDDVSDIEVDDEVSEPFESTNSIETEDNLSSVPESSNISDIETTYDYSEETTSSDFNNIEDLFNSRSGFDYSDSTESISVKTEDKQKDIDKDANKLFNDKYYNEEDKKDGVDETLIDFGYEFRGIQIKGKSILSKAKPKQKQQVKPKKENDLSDLHIVLQTFLKRGNALTVTGGRCSGKTLVASNIANVVSKLGYTVLLVDMDTKWRGISYITKEIYDTVHSGDTSKPSLRKAVNSTDGEIGRYVDIIRPGFHVLTTGLGCDMESVGEVIQPAKLNRFIHNAKSSYNFIIFDVAFEDLTTRLSDLLFATDDLIMCVDTSNHGLMELLLNLGNVESEEVSAILFGISQVLFNKVEKVEQVFGYKVKTVRQILRVLDNQMAELIGGEAEYQFNDLKVCGVLKYSSQYEKYWFSKYQVSDFADGEQIFIDILKKVLIKN